MRINVSARLAFAGAVAAAIVAVGVAPLGAAPTYASHLNSLTADDFHEVAQQGFGDRANSWAWSMAWFNNKLYVGTNRNYDCTTAGMVNIAVPPFLRRIVHYPPPDPNVLCPGDTNPKDHAVWDLPPTESAQIWSVDPSSSAALTQSNWTLAYADPYTIPITVENNASTGPRDIGYRGMLDYTEGDGTQALYVSGVGLKPLGGPSVPPPALLRSIDGASFQPVPADPGTVMGDINTSPVLQNGKGGCCMRGAVEFNHEMFIIIGGIQGEGTLFASSNPSAGDNSFQEITPPGMQVYEAAPYNGHLYLGLQSKSGYTVVWTDCLTPPAGQSYCPQTAFHQVVPPGGGLGKDGNGTAISMQVFTDPNGVSHLYVGTDSLSDRNGVPAEIVRINPDNSWDLVVGNARQVTGKGLVQPLSGLTSGFGWYYNRHMWRMAVYQNVLYVATFNGATNYLNDPIGAQLKPWMGFNVWASADGVTFIPVTRNGFGDIFSDGGRSLVATPYGLFVGSANWWYGLRIWQGSIPAAALQLAPQSLQADTAGQSGTVDLTWDAPGGAALYHVYRSVETLQMQPPPSIPDPISGAQPTDPPHPVWMPTPYTEIGTTSNPYFVDQAAPAGHRYAYYVVTQDAQGDLSAQSNIATAGPGTGTGPAPTFHGLLSLLASMSGSGQLSAAQTGAAQQTLQAALAQLRAGDTQGSQNQLQALQQQVLNSAQGPAARSQAELFALWLGRLAQRLPLVQAHVLSAASVG